MKLRLRVAALIAVVAALALVAASAATAAYPRPGSTSLVSVSSKQQLGEYCAAAAQLPTCARWVPESSSITPNGRFVAFASAADGLVPGDENHQTDVFVRDMVKKTTRLASVAFAGGTAVGPTGLPFTVGGSSGGSEARLSYDPSISADGRYVAFSSIAVNLVQGDTNGAVDVFVHDLRRRTTERVSVGAGRQESRLDPALVSPDAALLSPPVPNSYWPSISANGRYVSFTSFATNLTSKDTNGWADIFVHDRVAHRTARVSVKSGGGQSHPFLCPTPRTPGNCRYWYGRSSISASGRWVAFDSSAPDLVTGDTNTMNDVFAHDRRSHRTERISVGSNGEQAFEPTPWIGATQAGSSLTGGDNYAAGRSISNDGRFVTFVSHADNLIPADNNRQTSLGIGGHDVFVRDRRLRRTTRVSVDSVGRDAPPGAHTPVTGLTHDYPSLSPDGRFVAFSGAALVPGPYHNAYGTYVHDRLAGTTEFASPMVDGSHDPPAASGGGMADVAAGGRFITFTSGSWPRGWRPRNAASGYNVFRRDRGRVLGLQSMTTNGPVNPGPEPECLLGLCPSAVASQAQSSRATGAVLDNRLFSASWTRRRSGDAFLRIGVPRLAGPRADLKGADLNAAEPAVMFGARWRVHGHRYELRAVSAVGGPLIGVFSCAVTCTEVGRLAGGYGTTGEEVVAVIPAAQMPAADLPRVVVFAGRGTYLTGAHVVDDQLVLH